MKKYTKHFSLLFLTLFFLGQINAVLHFIFVHHAFSANLLTSVHIKYEDHQGTHHTDHPDQHSLPDNNTGDAGDNCQVLLMLTSPLANVTVSLLLIPGFSNLLPDQVLGYPVDDFYKSQDILNISPSNSPPFTV